MSNSPICFGRLIQYFWNIWYWCYLKWLRVKQRSMTFVHTPQKLNSKQTTEHISDSRWRPFEKGSLCVQLRKYQCIAWPDFIRPSSWAQINTWGTEYFILNHASYTSVWTWFMVGKCLRHFYWTDPRLISMELPRNKHVWALRTRRQRNDQRKREKLPKVILPLQGKVTAHKSALELEFEITRPQSRPDLNPLECHLFSQQGKSLICFLFFF